MSMVWVLTKEYNDYNQYGEYFIAVFLTKPTVEQLSALDVGNAEYVLSGGGRKGYEDVWYNLSEVMPVCAV